MITEKKKQDKDIEKNARLSKVTYINKWIEGWLDGQIQKCSKNVFVDCSCRYAGVPCKIYSILIFENFYNKILREIHYEKEQLDIKESTKKKYKNWANIYKADSHQQRTKYFERRHDMSLTFTPLISLSIEKQKPNKTALSKFGNKQKLSHHEYTTQLMRMAV